MVELAADLIRIDTSNYGDGTGPGEAEAAEYVEERLREVGLDPERFACAPRRDGVVVRIPGRDRTRGALLRARPPRRRPGAGRRLEGRRRSAPRSTTTSASRCSGAGARST